MELFTWIYLQACPLDLYTDCFYENRKEAIEARAELLSSASTETLQELLAEVWTSQEGRVCTLVNWERFSGLQQAQVTVFGENLQPEPHLFFCLLIEKRTRKALTLLREKKNGFNIIPSKVVLHRYRRRLCSF